MMVKFGLIFKAGFVWGLIGVLLVAVFSLLQRVVSFNVNPVGIATYAILFSGVHYARHDLENFGISLFGGAFAGLLAAALMLGAAWTLATYLSIGDFMIESELGAMLGAALAGIIGAFGMRLVDTI